MASLRDAVIVHFQIALLSRVYGSTHFMHFVVEIPSGHSGMMQRYAFFLRSVFLC